MITKMALTSNVSLIFSKLNLLTGRVELYCLSLLLSYFTFRGFLTLVQEVIGVSKLLIVSYSSYSKLGSVCVRCLRTVLAGLNYSPCGTKGCVRKKFFVTHHILPQGKITHTYICYWYVMSSNFNRFHL